MQVEKRLNCCANVSQRLLQELFKIYAVHGSKKCKYTFGIIFSFEFTFEIEH